MKNFKTIVLILSVVSFLSCKKDKKEPEPEPTPVPMMGPLQIHFNPMVDAAPLVLGTKIVNPKGDTMTINVFKYFISNIVLTKEDNSTYVVPESYHMIDNSILAQQTISLTNIPTDSYKSVKFMIGVDSARNKSGAQTGALDPAGLASGMFWSWNSGYIMFKIEGTAPKSGDLAKALTYHMGGFYGPNKTQRDFDLSFGTGRAMVAHDKNPKITLHANINEFFKNPTLIDVVTQYYCMTGGTTAKLFADNYADMISFSSISN